MIKSSAFPRWWRAPEVIVNWEKYNEKFDIWSVGCIMAELILRKPVFGSENWQTDTHLKQLDRIFDIIGTPDAATVDRTCTAGMQLKRNDLVVRDIVFLC